MPGPEGSFKYAIFPGDGIKLLSGIFGVDAALDGRAGPLNIASARMVSRSPAAMRSCHSHQIEAGDQFGHRMLHLQARVHFEEIEIAVAIDQKFDRAGVGVTRRARDLAAPPRPFSRAVRDAASITGDGHSSITF